ncbi:hypothetical protein NHX12_024054 [Muraenolepis orangiensis]|uniref:Uncharacterized protein n=1 Tax=Muraenolepis orangiensis TaxID=630683 RepID=A0A9Q0ISM9_9TELE|nr:hypothetical protein NHX12_024054 [Muraenolepis orangiensis]
MGNAQDKPPGSVGGGGAGGGKTDHSTPGRGRRSWGPGSTAHRPPDKAPAAANGFQAGGGHTGGQQPQEVPVMDTSYLDAPAGALPPPLARLKNEGNHLFKNGQFGEALEKYTLAIDGCSEAGVECPEDLSILHSNRAACYLKDGNSAECIQDCSRALELHPYALKPLLRRAIAHETLERYRNAYVDYKTVLQIDTGQQHQAKPVSAELSKARAARATNEEARRTEARFSLMKHEGNDLVKRGQYTDAVQRYSECVSIKPDECSVYTNRAICFLKLNQFAEAKEDCDCALRLEPTNKKAFYRRALAHKGLQVTSIK